MSRENRDEIRRFCQDNFRNEEWQSCLLQQLDTTEIRRIKDVTYICHPALDPDNRACVADYLAHDRFTDYLNDYLSMCKIPHQGARNCVRDLIVNQGFRSPDYQTKEICKRKSFRARQCLIDFFKERAPFGPNGQIRHEDDAKAYCAVSHPKDRECVLKVLREHTVSNLSDAVTLCMAASDQHRKCETIFQEYGIDLGHLNALQVCNISDYEMRSCLMNKLAEWTKRNYSVATHSYAPVPARNFELFIFHCNLYNLFNGLKDGQLSPSAFACEFVRTENMASESSREQLFPSAHIPTPPLSTWGSD